MMIIIKSKFKLMITTTIQVKDDQLEETPRMVNNSNSQWFESMAASSSFNGKNNKSYM